ncbi:MAG: DUF3794 domain-containing protein [Clostridia bacterium]|nr:DUF3794 domain-containing protein [Clostridia bacterium]
MPNINDLMSKIINASTFESTKSGETKEYALKKEFTVPEYLPEISSVLRVNADIGKSAKFINGDNAEYSGQVIYRIVYLDPENLPRALSLSSQFDHQSDIGALGDATVIFKPSVSGVRYTLTSPRKIELSSTVTMESDVITTSSIDIKNDDDLRLEKLCRDVVNREIKCYGTDNCIQKGEFEIPSDMPSIGKILNCTAFCSVIAAKCTNDGTDISINVAINLLYLSEESENEAPSLQYYKTSLPFEIKIENENGGGGECECFCTASIGDIDISADIDTFGSMRIVDISLGVNVRCISAQNKIISVCEDAFSEECDVLLKTDKIECRKLLKNTVSNFSDSITLRAANDGIDKVLDVYVKPKVTEKRAKQNGIAVGGSFKVYALIKTQSGEIVSLEEEKPFSYECDCAGITPSGTPDILCDFSTLKVTHKNDSSKVKVDYDLSVSLMVFCKSEEEYISSVSKGDAAYSASVGASSDLKIYYPDPDETLWSIAKRHHVSTDKIISANSLPKDTKKRDTIGKERKIILL